MKKIVIVALVGVVIGFVVFSLYQNDTENIEMSNTSHNIRADEIIGEIDANLEKKPDSLIQNYEEQIASLKNEVNRLKNQLAAASERKSNKKPFRELNEEVFTSKRVGGLDVSLESGKIRLRKNGGTPLVEIDAESQMVSFHDGVVVESEGKIFLNEAEIAGDLKSENSKEAAQLKFKNETSDDLYLFWVDFHSQPKFYKKIKPGESHGMKTYLTHHWVVTDKNGKRLDNLVAQYPGESEEIIFNESP